MASEYSIAAEPTFLDPQTPPKHPAPTSRTWYITPLVGTQPPPATMPVQDILTARVVRINVDDFDGALYVRIETLAVDAACAAEPVQ